MEVEKIFNYHFSAWWYINILDLSELQSTNERGTEISLWIKNVSTIYDEQFEEIQNLQSSRWAATQPKKILQIKRELKLVALSCQDNLTEQQQELNIGKCKSISSIIPSVERLSEKGGFV